MDKVKGIWGFFNTMSLLVIIVLLLLSLVLAQDTDINETNNKNDTSVKYDPQILEKFDDNQTWIRFIIYYQSNVENLNFDTIEERKNYVRNLTHSLFDYIPSTKMKNIRTGLSNSFVAEITEEGFNELIKNEKVSEIYLDVIGHVAEEGAVTVSPVETEVGKKTSTPVEENITLTENKSVVENILTLEEQKPEIIENISKEGIEEEPKSWFSKLIQFLKSLFGIK